MKTKTKFLSLIFSFIGAITCSNLMIATIDNKTILNSLEVETKTFDAKLIGAQIGTFTLEFSNPNNCKLAKVSDDFCAGDYQTFSKPFNFNNGRFISNEIEYVITEIGHEVFYCWTNWYFVNSSITIPSTIKKIDESAFNGCSKNGWCFISGTYPEIIEIKFEEGLEYIGTKAFRKCDDTYCNLKYGIALPNSLKYMGNDAFCRTDVEVFDLTALDHVIQVECDVDSKNGCLPWSTKKIYVKDETIKEKYLADNHWHNIAVEKMLVKY